MTDNALERASSRLVLVASEPLADDEDVLVGKATDARFLIRSSAPVGDVWLAAHAGAEEVEECWKSALSGFLGAVVAAEETTGGGVSSGL